MRLEDEIEDEARRAQKKDRQNHHQGQKRTRARSRGLPRRRLGGGSCRSVTGSIGLCLPGGPAAEEIGNLAGAPDPD